jgi:hypothetical protein
LHRLHGTENMGSLCMAAQPPKDRRGELKTLRVKLHKLKRELFCNLQANSSASDLGKKLFV